VRARLKLINTIVKLHKRKKIASLTAINPDIKQKVTDHHPFFYRAKYFEKPPKTVI